jgi:hypothetical protein
VTDDDGGSATDTAVLTVRAANQDDVTVSGPAAGVRGQMLFYLAALLSEWNSSRDYATRANNLQGVNPTADRLNGNVFLKVPGDGRTVHSAGDDCVLAFKAVGAGRAARPRRVPSGRRQRRSSLAASPLNLNDASVLLVTPRKTKHISWSVWSPNRTHVGGLNGLFGFLALLS